MEGVGYWIFLAVMYLLSSLFKKRQQQVPDESESFSEKKSNPFEAQFLKDMFGDLKEMAGVEGEKEKDNPTESDYLIDEEENIEPIEYTQEHDHVVFEDLTSTSSITKNKKEDSPKKEKTKTQKFSPLFFSSNDLKQGIIIKEILDKPRAYRRKIR